MGRERVLYSVWSIVVQHHPEKLMSATLPYKDSRCEVQREVLRGDDEFQKVFETDSTGFISLSRSS